ncbi:MAG: hypothetical protein K2I91_04820, partial [Muribaculaceae bacterium]|nr:hypothetical protein [Muribaculaceae bacterium]
ISYTDITDITAGEYIYIPNAAVMKSGAWGQLTHSFPDLMKLDPNTHIFVSDSYLPVFPGRIIQIDDIPDKKKYRLLKGEKFNVVCRNYIMQAPELEKKLKVTPGGDKYIIGCKCNGHPVLLCGHIVNSHYDKK